MKYWLEASLALVGSGINTYIHFFLYDERKKRKIELGSTHLLRRVEKLEAFLAFFLSLLAFLLFFIFIYKRVLHVREGIVVPNKKGVNVFLHSSFFYWYPFKYLLIFYMAPLA